MGSNIQWLPGIANADLQVFDVATELGSELPYAELLAAEDQRATALDLYRARLRALTA